MTYVEELAKLEALEKDIISLRAKVNKRRAELREKDLERRKKEFDQLPLEHRQAREAIGWSPYQEGQVVRRTNGTIAIKK